MDHKPSDIRESILMSLEGTADWRMRKAEEFPDDERNTTAAHELRKLAEGVAELDDDEYPLPQLAALCDRLGDENGVRASEIEQELARQVGFHASYDNAKAFLDALRGVLGELVARARPDLH